MLKEFDEKNGFGEYKQLAINLLYETINILDEFDIKHMLISGTLLGYVRHNDFIPWDDDIDMLVDSSIIDKMPQIIDKYRDKLYFINIYDEFIKFCSREKGNKIINHEYKLKCLNGIEYTFPFIDLFIYKINGDKLLFFKKEWDIFKFFPLKKTIFNNINVNIPIDADYFLTINYGKNYLKKYVSNNYIHKTETKNKYIKIIPVESFKMNI